MVDQLYEHTAYQDAPFGPYEKQRHVFRSGGVGIDVSNARVWITVLDLDTSPFKTGQLVIEADIGLVSGAVLPDGMDPSNAVEAVPWIEIRVVAKSGNSESVWFEGGLYCINSHPSPPFPQSRNSSILLAFKQGEVPDSILVYAQARQGAGFVPPGLFTMTVAAATRFVL